MSTSPGQAAGDQRPRRGGRLGLAVIGVVVAICSVGWAIVMAHVGQVPGISTQTITYRIVDDSTVEIRWQVAKPSGKPVRCVVDALDARFAPVAKQEVIVPAGRSHVERTDILRTTRRAAAARVKECRTI